MLRNREKFLIFVVDSEEIIASTIAAILRMKGFEAIPFTDAREALEASGSLMPDLLISEVLLLKLSGVELAQRMQWSHPGCRVLLFADPSDRADAEIELYQDTLLYQLIPKPVHPRELLKRVREMLATAPGSLPSEEERARLRTRENMKASMAAVQADIDAAIARKRSARRRSAHPSQELDPG